MADTDKLVKVGQLDTIVDEIVDKFGETNGRLAPVEECFSNPNVMSELSFDNRFCTTEGLVRVSSGSAASIIFRVTPLTSYYLKFENAYNRRVIIGNSVNEFVTNQTYTFIASAVADDNHGMTFTVPAGINYVMVYFYSGTYTYNASDFSLFEGNTIPTDTGFKLKEDSLPDNTILKNTFDDVLRDKSATVYGYPNFTKDYGLFGANRALTQVDGVGVSDRIYGITGKAIRWYHGVNNITNQTLWLVEYKADNSINASWGMLAGSEYRDIVSLKSDTAYIRCSYILSYAQARVQIANTTSCSTIYWKPEYIGGINAGIVPEYYFENQYLQSKCERIDSLLRESVATGDAFFFITDIHWDLNEQHSPSLIQYIHDHTGIDKVIDGGDRDDGYGSSPVQYELNAIRNSNVFPVVGNHEFLRSASRSEAFASAYQHIGNNVVWGEPGSFYYYYDNAIQKIRYIFLQSFDASGTDSGAINGYTQTELAWFNSALNVSAGWTIIIVTHSLITWTRETKEPVAPSGINANFVDAINNYNGVGTIACVIQGHLHGDWVYTLSGGVPVITTTCDKNDFYNEPALSDVVREDGTINEQAFDVFVINTSTRQINAVRVGCAVDFVDNITVEERTVTF